MEINDLSQLIKRTTKQLTKPVAIEGLVLFRIVFGLLMCLATVRFWSNGWIESLYIEPTFHFSYSGFEWVQCPSNEVLYLLFATLFMCAAGITLGFCYRVSTLLFFCLFSYIELIDKAYYLNHYYFVSLVSFLLIFLPAAKSWSIDALIKGKSEHQVSAWLPGMLRLQLALVYVFAGIAKLNSDWLLHAMPMKIWLPAHANFPIIGWLFDYETTAYMMSWAGAIYDLSIPILLLMTRMRPYAFALVICFHLMTWLLFPIGVFPWVMIGCSLIFVPYHRVLSFFTKAVRFFNFPKFVLALSPSFLSNSKIQKAGWSRFALIPAFLFFSIQVALPMRSWFMPGDVNWTESGFRFSWKVMLIEKAGYAQFWLTDPESCQRQLVNLCDYLTTHQQKMMQTQPDMILQFAHHLANEYTVKHSCAPEITAEVWVSYNGRPSQLLFNPELDLLAIPQTMRRDQWLNELNS